MIHRDPDEYVASRLTIWLLAIALVVWTVWFVVAGAVSESAPPLSSRPPAYAAAAQTQLGGALSSLAEERDLASRSRS